MPLSFRWKPHSAQVVGRAIVPAAGFQPALEIGHLRHKVAASDFAGLFPPNALLYFWRPPDHAASCWRAGHLEETVSFCGRVLTASELNLVRQIIADFPRLSQAELAYTICELMEWRRPNGKLKNPECVEWLHKWQQQALPALPQLRVTKPRGATSPSGRRSAE